MHPGVAQKRSILFASFIDIQSQANCDCGLKWLSPSCRVRAAKSSWPASMYLSIKEFIAPVRLRLSGPSRTPLGAQIVWSMSKMAKLARPNRSAPVCQLPLTPFAMILGGYFHADYHLNLRATLSSKSAPANSNRGSGIGDGCDGCG